MALGQSGVGVDERRPGFLDALRSRTFAVLYAAEAQSTLGDQLARIALAVLVFERTGSVADTALTYAATLLPAVLGGYLLAGIGDRLPRRAVMIGCDLARAGLFGVMALPNLPLAYVVGLLVVAVFIGPAFVASEISMLAATLGSDRFRAATGIRMVTGQAAQVAGFALGGILVTWLHPRGALLVDAATYVASAVLIIVFLRRRGDGDETPGARPEGRGSAVTFAGLWADHRLRALIALSALAGFFIVPEGLAVPFASRIGAGTTQTGFLLAALPLGGAVGAALLVRVVPHDRRAPVAGLMAIGCGLPLVVSAANPMWPVVWVTWLISGVMAAYQVEVVTLLVDAIPDELRSRSLGIVGAWLIGAQGAGLAVFGAVAHPIGIGRTIAIAGLIGSAIALALMSGPLRDWGAGESDRVGRHRRPSGTTTKGRS
jgi:Major Facilitator Superfamily